MEAGQQFNITLVDSCLSYQSYVIYPASLDPKYSIEYRVGETAVLHSSWMSEFRSAIPECGVVEFSLFDLARVPFYESESELAEIIEFDKRTNGIEVFTNDQSKAGLYTIQVVGYLSAYPTILTPDLKLTLEVNPIEANGYRVGIKSSYIGGL